MKQTVFKKGIALLLAVMMVVALIPAAVISSFAYDSSHVPGRMEYISSQVTPLAPGVEETQYTVLDKNGDQVVYYAITADIASNDSVMVKANYHDNDNTGVWGKATVIEQANAAKEKRGYNVVATTNAAYYNVSTGQPTGAFVMEGVNINGTGTGNSHNFFAIMKDGTAMIGKKGTFSQYADDVQEAVGGWNLLIWEGEIVTTADQDKYPRSTVGIKANGDVVLMVADGNQKPYSVGLTYLEQAQIMLSLGCEYAVELDGGGSATYAAKAEGTDEVVIRSSPCDGAVRAVSNSLMVISTAVADGTFHHANLDTAYDYYVPHSQVNVISRGVDAGGGSAEIPADVEWALADDSFGTVADGVFTSNGKLGDVDIQMMYGGEVVGTTTVSVVNPETIAFDSESKSVPFGKSTVLTLEATYAKNSVYMDVNAVDLTLSDNDAATIDGAIFTAAAEESGKTGVTVTATYKYASLAAASVVFTYGKESSVLFDFEGDNGDLWTGDFDKVKEHLGDKVVDIPNSSNGIAEGILLESFISNDYSKTGDSSLGVTIDYTQSSSHGNWQYAYLYYLGDPIVYRDVENGVMGTRIGMWMYIPEEAVGSCARLVYSYYTDAAKTVKNTNYLYMTYQYVEKGFSKLTTDKIPEAGWAYVYVDLFSNNTAGMGGDYFTSAQDDWRKNTVNDPSDYYPAFIQFIISSSHPGAEKCTFYIDDITLDYGDVTPDRDAPIISDAKLYTSDGLTSAVLGGNTINYNDITVSALVAEDLSHAASNATGLDLTTAQIYVDGQAVATIVNNGLMSSDVITLPNGAHDITFEIADKEGNYTKVTKTITVAAESAFPTVTVVGTPSTEGLILTGSVYTIDLVVDQIETIDELNVTIHLGSAHNFEVEHSTTLAGFTYTYSVNELARTATITVTRTGANTQTGEATVLSIPTRVWYWNGDAGWDAKTQWTNGGDDGACAPQLKYEYKVLAGSVKYVSTYTVDAKGYVPGFSNVKVSEQTEMNTSIQNIKNEGRYWHVHADHQDTWVTESKPATCTEAGYTDRVTCGACRSVIDWGTAVPATGHNFVLFENTLICDTCDVTIGRTTGLIEVGDALYYAINGTLRSGWQVINGIYYYFDAATFQALDGVQTIDGYTYTFVDFVLTYGHWINDGVGMRYRWAGAWLTSEWIEIDGDLYYFDPYSYRAEGVKTCVTPDGGLPTKLLFTEEGVWLVDVTGFYTDKSGNTYYLDAGKPLFAGVVQDEEGNLYYVNSSLTVVKNTTRMIRADKCNGLLDPTVTYIFDENGVILNPVAPPVEPDEPDEPETEPDEPGAEPKNGIVKDSDGYIRYYVDGVATAPGVVQDDEGNYYYFGSSKYATTNNTRYLSESKTNGLLPAGEYTFGADGKIILPDQDPDAEPKNGIVLDEDGYIRYYVDGVATAPGVVKDDEGNYYYFGSSKYATTNNTRYLSESKTNGLLPAGEYTFGADGKIILPEDEPETEIKNGIIKDEDGYIRYYVNGEAMAAGVVKDAEGNYYYFGSSKYATTNNTRYLSESKTNGLIPAGEYTFGADGKIIMPDAEPDPELKNGIVLDEDGYIRYYENGVATAPGLVQDAEGNYYYFGSSKYATTNNTRYLSESKTNGLLPAGEYTFGADGKIILPEEEPETEIKNGIIKDEDGYIRYYVEGFAQVAGLVQDAEGNYYYFGSSKYASVNVTRFISASKTNGLLPEGTYTFDAEGKLVLPQEPDVNKNGIFEEDGELYYYEQGERVHAGLIFYNGAFYYVENTGMVVRNVTRFVSEGRTNGLLPAGEYTFGEDGCLIG